MKRLFYVFLFLSFAMSLPAQQVARMSNGVNVLNASASPKTFACSDALKLQVVDSVSAFSAVLPRASSCHIGLVFSIKTIGAGLLTITVASSGTIDGISSMLMPRYQGVDIFDDGTNWVTQPGKGSQIHSCSVSLGDGRNAIPAGTYVLRGQCRNNFGVTFTITGVSCLADNAGTSTCDATTSHAGTPDILTGPITANSANTYVAGTQSATNTALANEYFNVTFVADGTTTVITLDIQGTT